MPRWLILVGWLFLIWGPEKWAQDQFKASPMTFKSEGDCNAARLWAISVSAIAEARFSPCFEEPSSLNLTMMQAPPGDPVP